MAADFKFIVIGRGMMGAAAARHLARQTNGVAVIGPDEPADRKVHSGVFASHYDEGRITRTIDPDPNWALLANRSIARYRELERESGIAFYSQVGCLAVGPRQGGADAYIDHVAKAAEALKVRTERFDDDGLRARFPFFAFDRGSEGIYEPQGAGHISPRRLVKAQSLLAEKVGAKVLKETVVSIRDEGGIAVVTTGEGNVYRAEKALLAAGGFSIAASLLAAPVEMIVRGRTIAYFEISEADAMALGTMPSLITKGPDDVDSIYLLPPIRYPDGKYYLKIGGDPDDYDITSDAEMRAWFRTDGRASVRDHLTRIVRQLVPDLRPLSISSGACVTSYSPSTYPMIGYTASPRIGVLTGCSGTSAKSSDEIGRLGAELLLEGRINDDAYSTDFAPYFRQ
ncbi:MULTISPECIES: NAD(P)/FAD-dependent oxidoreductase [unclassified Rhizobium]|uniref:NAD(P)/FAD-dependent oxidoreductase n=1 Tax=unclassified Rhizobium TaxID=2613769 RepID=UPI001ADB88BC|nr:MULTISPECIES: FAD-dependent oxidoreductase [unclassified Rhizobium]MBO9098893.1 FAD-dependent oxidoreductase [Rhizobium sp. L58/93]MBO9185108.1 FAD-dependent oxidoreductase [Rhizobium sp. E27B/91]QXZ85255.1 FAD-dependent oxidoreductase [Rhizobium sp. K1/93]QXZ90606.1 FAD-dependent oxidoreductase [Rhizobium sp. K15/93]QYA03145.1 FAD-dependent oxidoreductase [Rhizobium sp. B21/90]